MDTDVIGIGYEGLDLDGLISRLRLRGVRTVVDVRLNPISRKRGLSKNGLSVSLREDGIGYEHLPALGNPRDNREGFAELKGAAAEDARERFAALLASDTAADALQRILDIAQSGTVALLCFEKDESHCHRELILAALQARLAAV